MNFDRKNIRWNGWGWNARRAANPVSERVWAWLAGELGMPALLATPTRPLEEVQLPPPKLSSGDQIAIAQIVGSEQARSDPYERAMHALGRSYHDLIRLRAGMIPHAPDLVIYPRSKTEVLSILALASERGIAVIPFGGGTSVVGGVTADPGVHGSAVTIDLSQMNALITCDARSLTATAEAGIYGPELEDHLQSKGFTLGHFPQSFEFSTLGGWIAHGGSGQSSQKYGRVDDWLLGVSVATPRGLLETRAVPASASGPNLTKLIIGSEGTLGIITDATFRVQPRPATRHYCAFLFRSFELGADTIRRAVQERLPAAMLRLSDVEETRFQHDYASVGRSELRHRAESFYLRARGFEQGGAVLIAGFEGDRARVSQQSKRFHAIAREAGALRLGEGPGQRWLRGRFEAPYLRDEMMDRGVGVDTFETATNWSNIAHLYGATNAALQEAMRMTAPKDGFKGIAMCHISHAYADGASLYFTCIFPRRLDDENGQWRTIKKAVTDAVVAHGGTLSHHHGIGEDHLAWMEQEKGSLGLDVLLAAKTALDPKGVLNPGKLIPARK